MNIYTYIKEVHRATWNFTSHMDVRELPYTNAVGFRVIGRNTLDTAGWRTLWRTRRKKIRECDERGMWENMNIMSNRWRTSPSTPLEEQWHTRPVLRKQFKQRPRGSRGNLSTSASFDFQSLSSSEAFLCRAAYSHKCIYAINCPIILELFNLEKFHGYF